MIAKVKKPRVSSVRFVQSDLTNHKEGDSCAGFCEVDGSLNRLAGLRRNVSVAGEGTQRCPCLGFIVPARLSFVC